MSYYLLAIGGTGNKILEAMVYACAAGALYTVDEDQRQVPIPALHALIVDVDAACGNTTRAKQAAEHYEQVRQALSASRAPRRGFHTELTVERWNMNLAKRAASVYGMTQNHRRDRLLADSLFSRTESQLEYSEGFRGHPDLGVLFFADLLGNLDTLAAEGQPDEMVVLLARMRAELDAGETVRVLLAGSIFGGTGASGIPSVSRFLRERFRDHADRFVLSAVLMLPYYDVPAAAVDETMEIVVKSSAFLDKARTALQYYGMEGMIRSGEDDARGVYDALYLLGLPKEAFVTQRIYSTGSQSQENDAHLLEWLAVRCAARFYRTGFRGEDAHNMDCYYYQCHSREISWDSFDTEAALYHGGFGGLIKASALFFAECYPTLRAVVQQDDRKLLRTVNYAAAYFYDLGKFTGAQRAQLEKLLDSLYRLLAFYTNWMWQVLRTLPPTLRPETPEEAAARELAAGYRRYVEVRAMLAALQTPPQAPAYLAPQAPPYRGEADRAAEPAAPEIAAALQTEFETLNARLPALIDAVGGSAYLSVVQAEKTARLARLDAQRLALMEQQERVTRYEGEDSRLIDPATLAMEQNRLLAMERAFAAAESRAALVTEDALRAVEQRVADRNPAPQSETLTPNQLFDPTTLNDLHTLLTQYGSPAETSDPRKTDALRRSLWASLHRLVLRRVPDPVTAVQAAAGMGGGSRRGEGPQAAFAGFTAALLTAVSEEESL